MVRKLVFAIILLGLGTAGVLAGGDTNYNEYNHRMARISYIQNNLSFAHGDEEWTAASINTPLQPGDRLYAPAQSRAEVQFDDGSALRLGGNTEATLTRLDDDHIQIRLSVGLATLHVNSSLYFEVNTPSAAVTADEKGTYRIEVQENGGVDLKVRKGRATVYNQALQKQIRKGEHIIIYNQDGADFEVAQLGHKDEWDDWNERRDAALTSRTSARYLPDAAYMGAYDLDGYGHWSNVGGYGSCWFPSVAGGWSPYRVGRWVYRPFWGWTWISYEPWGWLPYHYGRWFYDASFGWGWYPGSRHSFYFWSPGLVRFSYGPDWVGWCPLGPRDYVSFNLFFGRSYYRSYAVNLGFGFGGGGVYGYNNLYNYRAPNSIVYVNHNTFINNSVTNIYNNNSYTNTRRLTYNTLQLPPSAFNAGTIVKDHQQLPLKPTVASFSPNPTATVRAPRPEFVNRPVFTNTPRPLGRGGVRPQDAAAGGLTVRPQPNNGSRTVGTPQGATAAPATTPFGRPGGRDAQVASPTPQPSRSAQSVGPVAPKSTGTEPFGRPASPSPAGRNSQPGVAPNTNSGMWPTAPARSINRPSTPTPNSATPSLSAPNSGNRPSATPVNPTPTTRPGRSDWPTAPAHSVDRPGAPVHNNAGPTAPAPRNGDRPSINPASPAPAARPGRPESSGWPTAPARSNAPAPNAPPASARPSVPTYSAPPARGGDRPSGAPAAPPKDDNRQKPSGRQSSFYSAPPSNRGFVQAPNRESSPRYNPPPARESRSWSNGGNSPNFGAGYARGRESGSSAPPSNRGFVQAPNHEPSPRYNPPPARESRSWSNGGNSPNFGAGYARGHESGSSAPRYNPPPAAHSSAPPARSAPSYSGGFGHSNGPSYSAPAHSSPAPSYGGGMGRSMGNASSGSHGDSGGRGGDHRGRR